MPEDLQSDVTAAPAAGNTNEAPLGTPPAAAEGASPGTRPEQKNLIIPTSSMKKIRDEEFSRGRSAAFEELAKSAGFESPTDLASALAKLKNPPVAAASTAAPTPAAVPAGGEAEDPEQDLARAKDAKREAGRYQRQLEKLVGERDKYAYQVAEWQKRAKAAQDETDGVRAEMHLRTLAAGVGVQEIDYALQLFSREVERLTPEQAQTFDERAFFEGLRKSKPYLFGETVQPATTGTGVGGAPTPPRPNQVAAANGANGRVDVRKMNPQQLAVELAKRGINPLSQ